MAVLPFFIAHCSPVDVFQLLLYKIALLGVNIEGMLEIPFFIGRKHIPEGGKIGVVGLKDLYFIGVVVISTVVIIKMNAAVVARYTIQAAASVFVTYIYVKLFAHTAKVSEQGKRRKVEGGRCKGG
jgi:hypothetical protein